jgi:hypothetical protein
MKNMEPVGQRSFFTVDLAAASSIMFLIGLI